MSIIITIALFVIVLGILVFAHELGHFSIAKLFKIKVEEFGFGFPPRIWGVKRGETTYSLNWIPFGGFVRIFGEDNQEALSEEDKKRSFVNKPKLVQVAVLVAGIVFNLIFAWILVSIVVANGVPLSTSSVDPKYLENIELTIVSVVPGSPAGEAGVVPGDSVEYIKYDEVEVTNLDLDKFYATLQAAGEKELTIGLEGMDGATREVSLKAERGVLPNNEDALAIGVGPDMIGITSNIPLYVAPVVGGELTWYLTKETAKGYVTIIADLFRGNGGEVLQMVSGPLGIAGLVGSAAAVGFTSLLMLTAIISVSLAIINLLPFPALDGGRILFVIIEAIKGSPIKSTVAITINTIGFFILIGLLLIVTFSDITKLFT